jgi:hypothetical protein
LRARMLVAIAVATVGVAASAWAATDRSSVHSVAPSTPFQAVGLLDASGNPELSVDYFPDGAGDAMHWSMCTPADKTACEPIPSKNGSADLGPKPAGTVFKVTAMYQGRTYASSLTWGGAIGVAAPPA